MKDNISKTRWLCRTALLLAVLVAAQYVTKPMGQIVTGSCVNAVLAVSALLINCAAGICVAFISPFAAFLLGIGPAFFPLTPIIALGNCLYVLLLSLLWGKEPGGLIRPVLSVAAAAAAKAGLLYLLVVQGLCRLAELKPPQIATFSVMFSWPQLITALIGGAVAVVLVRALDKIVKK